jgi:peptidoglycan hydrolase CwlO-like protein
MEKFRYVQDSEKIDVIDEVPSYDEYQSLKKEIDSLKEQIHSMLFTDNVVQERYDKSVQKMHILEQQLQEANEVIKHYAEKNGYHKAMDYLNKWCAK